MPKIHVSADGWSEYCGSFIRFQAEIGCFIIRRGSRIYFATTLSDAKTVGKALSILEDPELVGLRAAISDGLAAFAAFSAPSSSSKH